MFMHHSLQITSNSCLQNGLLETLPSTESCLVTFGQRAESMAFPVMQSSRAGLSVGLWLSAQGAHDPPCQTPAWREQQEDLKIRSLNPHLRNTNVWPTDSVPENEAATCRDLTFCAEAAARPMSQPPAHDVWLSRPHVQAPGCEQRYSPTDKCPLP